MLYLGYYNFITVHCAPRYVVLQKEFNIYQIFHFLNKKIQQKFLSFSDLCFNRMNNFESFIRKIDLLIWRLEQIINNDFIQLEAE